MPTRKTPVIITIVILLAVLAGAAYFTRPYWTHAVPSMNKEAGGFMVFEKSGVKYKQCYVCPMHKQIVKSEPGDCPICGMTLMKTEVPLTESKPAPKMEEMSGMKAAPAKPGETSAQTEGLRRISIDPRQRMLANVATTMVMYNELSQDVYTVGKVAFNEQTMQRVTAWFPGRVEKLYVNFTGETVKKGQRIMSVYSPELISTEKEYIIARDSAARLGPSEFPEIATGANGMLDAAKTRLRLWGLTAAQISELDRTGNIKDTVDIYSPVTGTVTDVMARPGNYLAEGTELYKVVDLGSVWVMADVYEYEFSKVNLGSRVDVTAEAYPGKTFVGKVSFIDPSVNPDSRTVKVRAELRNPGGMLKPEMFVNARIFSRSVHALTVPSSAVLYTGTRNVAWVEVEPGVFEYRDLTLGIRSGGDYQVISGLKEHDMVVTQGGFLLDSEAQFRASAGGGTAGMDMGKKPGTAPTKPEAPAKKSGGMPGMPGM